MNVTVFHWDWSKFESKRDADSVENNLRYKILFGDVKAIETAMGLEATGKSTSLILSKVADVEVEDINQVFELTNHIDRSWTSNPGVTAMPGSHRSTSVGDVYLVDDAFYAVCNVGLKRLELDGARESESAAHSAPRG